MRFEYNKNFGMIFDTRVNEYSISIAKACLFTRIRDRQLTKRIAFKHIHNMTKQRCLEFLRQDPQHFTLKMGKFGLQ